MQKLIYNLNQDSKVGGEKNNSEYRIKITILMKRKMAISFPAKRSPNWLQLKQGLGHNREVGRLNSYRVDTGQPNYYAIFGVHGHRPCYK